LSIGNLIKDEILSLDNSDLLHLINSPESIDSEINEVVTTCPRLRDILFEHLYPKVDVLQSELSWEVSLMLMEMNVPEIKVLFTNTQTFKARCAQALQEFQSMKLTRRVRKVIELASLEQQKMMIAERLSRLVFQSVKDHGMAYKSTDSLFKSYQTAQLLNLMDDSTSLQSTIAKLVQDVTAKPAPQCRSNDNGTRSQPIKGNPSSSCQPTSTTEGTTEFTECNFCGRSVHDSDSDDDAYDSILPSRANRRKNASKVSAIAAPFSLLKNILHYPFSLFFRNLPNLG
jgi:hypothetical protein